MRAVLPSHMTNIDGHERLNSHWPRVSHAHGKDGRGQRSALLWLRMQELAEAEPSMGDWNLKDHQEKGLYLQMVFTVT